MIFLRGEGDCGKCSATPENNALLLVWYKILCDLLNSACKLNLFSFFAVSLHPLPQFFSFLPVLSISKRSTLKDFVCIGIMFSCLLDNFLVKSGKSVGEFHLFIVITCCNIIWCLVHFPVAF